jgi:hypothetical protein
MKEQKKIRYPGFLSNGELCLMNSDLEIHDYDSTSIAELLLFKAYLFQDSRLKAPIFYEEDFSRLSRLPSDAVLKSFQRLKNYLSNLHFHNFKSRDVIHNRG